MNNIDERSHFICFRVIFGLYLVLHFSFLIPYSVELFSSEGMLPVANLNLSYPYFPNFLYLLDSSIFVLGILFVAVVLSIALMIGFYRRWASFLLWFISASLYHRNNMIENPSLAYIGWLLLALSFIPENESKLRQENDKWEMPRGVMFAAWLVLGFSYTVSGLYKWQSVGWREGLALQYALENPMAYNTVISNWILSLPESILEFATLFILLIEVIYLPMIFFKKTRLIIWLISTFMHLLILFLLDFSDLTFGMLMMHLFVFDYKWISPIWIFLNTLPSFNTSLINKL